MIKIKLVTDDKVLEVKSFMGEKLLDVLRKEDIKISMPCGGKGRCGKCKVKVEMGNVEPTNEDKKFFTNEEIKDGWRLGCRCILTEDATIKIEENRTFQITEEYINIEENIEDITDEDANYNFGYAVAVDIGTTTICFELINLLTGKRLDTFSLLNSQSKYGSDVITRISEANNGKLSEMNSLIKNDILDGINRITAKYDKSLINKIIISGNTTMIYILLNMDCTNLGEYPFDITTKTAIKYSFERVFKSDEYLCRVIIIPSISAFVGGDIISGAVMCNIDENVNTILIDIGTNGEIILNANNTLFCTSCAAGPAFEGGNILNGIGSVEGAIYKAKYSDGKFNVNTIADKKPVGICGSGIIDIIAELLENKLIDNEGLLTDKYFESGIEIYENIKFIQKDIRQFQLAKSAVRTGIECIIKSSGINISDIDKVYLAGGFGFNINIDNSCKIGLIPEQFKEKIVIAGNTSLGGLSKFINSKCIDKANYIANNTNEIILAQLQDFNDNFIKFINF